MHNQLQELKRTFIQGLSALKTRKDLELFYNEFLGRKGLIQQLMQDLKAVPDDQKPLLGKEINDLKSFAEKTFKEASDQIDVELQNKRLQAEKIDLTLPGRLPLIGGKHPVLAMLDKAVDILISMGFSVQLAPDVESDYHNFESLNYPPDHPARDMQDTFYITQDLLLRTHNTSIQMRMMEASQPPIRVICPGKCFRNEEINARSHVFFHQIDALYIDKDVSLKDLISTIEEFFKKLIGSDLSMRVRGSYFPFVEPGIEIDFSCLLCKGSGCSVCKQSGWLEVAGAGMVHPEVLKNGGLDSELYTGYAWGMGIERLAMLQYGINDIRLFTQNDLRFLRQFS